MQVIKGILEISPDISPCDLSVIVHAKCRDVSWYQSFSLGGVFWMTLYKRFLFTAHSSMLTNPLKKILLMSNLTWSPVGFLVHFCTVPLYTPDSWMNTKRMVHLYLVWETGRPGSLHWTLVITKGHVVKILDVAVFSTNTIVRETASVDQLVSDLSLWYSYFLAH